MGSNGMLQCLTSSFINHRKARKSIFIFNLCAKSFIFHPMLQSKTPQIYNNKSHILQPQNPHHLQFIKNKYHMSNEIMKVLKPLCDTIQK